MRITGCIYPTGDGTGFNRDAWCQFIRGRAELRRPPPRQARNPFKPGEEMTIQPTEDTAQVMIGDLVVGGAHWSMSEEPLVVVTVEPSAIPLVHEWAAAMGGEFRQEFWEGESDT